ncbi:MAG: AsmA family protein [Elusimicrobiaceae bacterium]|nr:AsmA family protein [Elusimicrobiaceae bacterium]
MSKNKKNKTWKYYLKRFVKTSFIWGLRAGLFISMFLLLVCACAWLVFIKMFNAQHISEIITAELQKRLDRPVAIATVDLKFINTLELKGFRVLDTEGAPGQALLSADSVTVRFRLWPLFNHQLIIDEVAFHTPRFSVVRSREGTYNIPPIKTSQTSVYTNDKTGRKLLVSIEDWTLQDGVLSYKDLASGVTHAIYGLNMHFERLRFDELSRFTMDMVLRSEWTNGISDIEIKGTGHINFANFDWSNFALRSLRAHAYLFKKPVDLTLDLDNLRTPFFNIKANIPAFTSKDLSVFHLEKIPFSVPRSTVTAKGVVSDSYHVVKINQVAVTSADIKVDGKGKFDFTQAPYTADLEASTNTFSLAGKDKYYPALERYKLSGKTSIKALLARGKGKYNWPLMQIQAQEVSGDIYGFLVEKVSGQFIAKENFADLFAATSTGKLTVDKTVFDKMDLSGTWRKGNLYAHLASCEVNGVPLKMSVTVNNLKSARRRIRTAMYWKHFNPMNFIGTVRDFVTVISPLIPGGTHFPEEVSGNLAWLRNFRDRLPSFMSNFAGSLVADTFESPVLSGTTFNAEFELTGLRPGMKELSGQIDAQLRKGVVHQMEKWAEEQQALNITFQPFIIMHRMERAGSFKVGKVLKDVPFTDMAASAAFENGKMDIKNAYTVGPSISATVSGWVDWAKENFDIIVWTMFSNTSRSGALAENLTDESGNPALAFRISSSMLKPKVEMQRAKKTGAEIRAAQEKGLPTDFQTAQDFIKGDFHAKK